MTISFPVAFSCLKTGNLGGEKVEGRRGSKGEGERSRRGEVEGEREERRRRRRGKRSSMRREKIKGEGGVEEKEEGLSELSSLSLEVIREMESKRRDRERKRK